MSKLRYVSFCSEITRFCAASCACAIASNLISYNEDTVAPVVASVIAIPAKKNTAGFVRKELATRIMFFRNARKAWLKCEDKQALR